MSSGTLIFGRCLTVAAAIALGLSLTVARTALLGRTTARWLLVICVVGGGVQLANVYATGSWPLYLLWIVVLVALGAIAAEYRFRAARKRSS